MVYQVRVRKKGVIILPKDVREKLDIKENDVLLGEIRGGELVLRPLKPKIVSVDPKAVEESLKEEGEAERRKGEEIFDDSRHRRPNRVLTRREVPREGQEAD